MELVKPGDGAAGNSSSSSETADDDNDDKSWFIFSIYQYRKLHAQVNSPNMVSLAGPPSMPPINVDRGRGWELWERWGSPRFVAAPMVWQSERCWRRLARNHGVHLAYTPMVNAFAFVDSWRRSRGLSPFLPVNGGNRRTLQYNRLYDSFKHVAADVTPTCSQTNSAKPEDRPLLLQFCKLVMKPKSFACAKHWPTFFHFAQRGTL